MWPPDINQIMIQLFEATREIIDKTILTRNLWCCLVRELRAQGELAGDTLEVVSDGHPGAGQQVGVAEGEGGRVVRPLVVGRQLQGLPLRLRDLGHHLTPEHWR